MRSSPGPKTGCSHLAGRVRVSEVLVAILTRSEDRVQQFRETISGRAAKVAILTRSEDRVQLRDACPLVVDLGVAILTRSEDRVQHLAQDAVTGSGRRLRSSPGPKTGCSYDHACLGSTGAPLRSSPGPKTGCSRHPDQSEPHGPGVAILTRSEDRVQPTGRPPSGGTGLPLRSSPGPKTGCSDEFDREAAAEEEVAILTRSEDRVQRRPADGWEENP